MKGARGCPSVGAWYVTLVTHFELPDVAPPPPRPERTVGVDLGLTELAVLSDGEHVPAPKHYRRAERKLARLQRKLARCQRGSKNREQARAKVARQHQKVANQRRDFLHRLSIRLVRQFDAISIENVRRETRSGITPAGGRNSEAMFLGH